MGKQLPESHAHPIADKLRRILVVSHVGDTKFKNGGTVYTRSILDLIRHGHPDVEIDLEFFTKQTHSLERRMRQAKALLGSMFSRLPSKALYFKSHAFEEKLRASCLRRRYDLVIIDHAEMLWCVRLVPTGTAMVAVAHNLESELYRQFLSSRPVMGKLLARDLRKYEAYEFDGLEQIGNIIAISADDARRIAVTAPDLNILVIPPAFSYESFERSRGARSPLRLGLLGNFEWWPNRAAYEWFTTQVWPHVGEGIELHVFGLNSDSLTKAPGTTSHGFVSDLNDVWKGVDLMVNPMVAGSGVNVKVAEAIYNGMPMICTPLAVAGLEFDPDPAIAICVDANQWIQTLRGDDALELAKREPREQTRRRVSSKTYQGPLVDFLARIKDQT